MLGLPAPDLILEEGACLLLNKPGGLLTQGPPGIDSLELRVKQFLKARDEKPGKVYLGVPHRLDRPASGVLVFVKNVRAANRLAQQFRERTVFKKYWAVVEGTLEEDAGTWIDYMEKIPGEAKSRIVSNAPAERAQQAILRFKVVDRSENKTWLEIQLETGRTHQIRLQAAHHGFPILGDQLYDAKTDFGPQSMDSRRRWIALHARQIVFQHPVTKQPMDVSAPLGEYWHQLPFDFS